MPLRSCRFSDRMCKKTFMHFQYHKEGLNFFHPIWFWEWKKLFQFLLHVKIRTKNNSDIFNCCSPFFSVFWNVIVTYFSKSQKNPKGCYFWYFIGLPHFSPVWNTFLMCNSKWISVNVGILTTDGYIRMSLNCVILHSRSHCDAFDFRIEAQCVIASSLS